MTHEIRVVTAFAIFMALFAGSALTQERQEKLPTDVGAQGMQARTLEISYSSGVAWPEKDASMGEIKSFLRAFHSLGVNNFGYIVLVQSLAEEFFTSHLESLADGKFGLHIKFEDDPAGKLDHVQLYELKGKEIISKAQRSPLVCRAGSGCKQAYQCELGNTCVADLEFDSFEILYKAVDKGNPYELRLSEKEFWLIAGSREFFTSRIHGMHDGIAITIHDARAMDNGSIHEIVLRGLRDPRGVHAFASEEHVKLIRGHTP